MVTDLIAATEVGFGRVVSVFRRRSAACVDRLRAGGWPVVQTAVAASLGWYLATLVLGHERPFVAAIAAVISVGAVAGQTFRRATEWVVGVAFGLAVADLVVLAMGTGTVQIGLVVALAMGTAILIGGGPLLVTEAGVSALLVATLDPSTYGLSSDRFLEALMGGGVALAVSALFPNDPRIRVEKAARTILGELVTVLREAAAALEVGDLGRAEKALVEARRIDRRVDELKETVEAGYQTARFSPPRWRALGQLGYYATAAEQLDLAVRNTRVLVRSAASMVREGRPAPGLLPEAIQDLAQTVEALAAYLEKPEHPVHARWFALEAAQIATAALEERHDLATSVLVGQVRSTAVDLLQASGLDFATALQALHETAGHATQEPPQPEHPAA